MNKQLKYLPTNRQNTKHNGILSSQNSFYAMNLEIIVLSERKWKCPIIKDGTKNDLYHSWRQGSAAKKEQNSYSIHTCSTHPASVPRDGPHAVLYWSKCGQCRSVLTEIICLSCFSEMTVSSGVNSEQKAAELESVLYAWFMFSIFKSLLGRYTCV